MPKGHVGTVLLEVVLLTFVVILVDERWLRAAIAFVPAMLLAQNAIHVAVAAQQEPEFQDEDRRNDAITRAYVDGLLKHFREFYSACHLMGTGQISPETARERVSQLEMELNRVLADMTQKAKAGVDLA